MPQMVLVGPLGELDLCDELRLHPSAPLHHFLRKRNAAAGILWFRKIRERANVRFERAHAVVNLPFDRRYESVADLRNEDQLPSIVVPDEERIEGFGGGEVAAYDELLSGTDSAFDPGATTPPRFVHAVSAFSDHALEAVLRGRRNQLVSAGVQRSRMPDRIRCIDERRFEKLTALPKRQARHV